MKIETQKPNIVRIAYHQEKGDPYYGSCLWAYFDFDLDKYMLNIQSDAGNAAYRWHATPDYESFPRLMARIDDDYLKYKLFGDPETVDIDATLKEVREQLGLGDDGERKDECLTDRERNDREQALDYLESTLSGIVHLNRGAAEHALDEWNYEYDFDLCDIWECVETDYAAWQDRIVQIFMDYIQPEIAKLDLGGTS